MIFRYAPFILFVAPSFSLLSPHSIVHISASPLCTYKWKCTKWERKASFRLTRMDDSLQMDTRGGAKRREADEEGPAVPTLDLAIAQIAHIKHRFNAEKGMKIPLVGGF